MRRELLEINGATGGGQVLRSSLTLSAALGIPFHIRSIRSKRQKPGLMRQHLTCVKAMAQMCDAVTLGAELNSTDLTFVPGEVRADDYRFDIGSGGSTTLAMQALLPAFASVAGNQSLSLAITGGTHCPLSPTLEFTRETLIPQMRAMGYPVELFMGRGGFHQIGGGIITAVTNGSFAPVPYSFMTRGRLIGVTGTVISNNLREDIPQREIATLMDALQDDLEPTAPIEIRKLPACGNGNAIVLRLSYESGVTVTSAIGTFNASAENVARTAATEAINFARNDVPVSRHLADQLLVPLTLAAGGTFRTTTPSAHTRACADVIGRFTGKPVLMTKDKDDLWTITVQPARNM